MKKTLKNLGALILSALTVAALAAAASAIDVVSVTTENEHENYLAVYSVDGDDEKFWHTKYDGDAVFKEPPFILTYELAEPTEIQSVGLLPRLDSSRNGLIYWFKINVSDDGVNFTTAQEVDYFEYIDDVQTAELDNPVTAKFVQLEIIETETFTNGSLNQLYINGEAAILDPDIKAALEAAKLAEEEAAKAAAAAALQAALEANGFKSITTDDQHESYLAVYAGDGNPEQFWHTDWNKAETAFPYSITFELNGKYSVSELTLTARPGLGNGVIKAFNLYTSVDGENFTQAQAFTGLDETVEVTTLTLDAPVEARFLKLEVTEAAGGNFASLNELDYVGELLEAAPAETEAPAETAAPETEAPAETAAPETEAPAETAAPETVPAVEEPETVAPETAAPETTAPVVEAPAEDAPQTGDAAAIIVAAMAVVSGAGVVVMKKRKN